jgi:hypothetical protein
MRRLYFFVVLVILFLQIVLAQCNSSQIDINSASLEKLDEIIWVGPATAEKIVNGRPFENLDCLINVSGIGEVKLAAIKNQNLACFEEIEEEKIEEFFEEDDRKEVEEGEIIIEKIVVEREEIVKDVLVLSPQTIKSEKNVLDKDKLAKIGLLVFPTVLLFLFVLKLKNGHRKRSKSYVDFPSTR